MYQKTNENGYNHDILLIFSCCTIFPLIIPIFCLSYNSSQEKLLFGKKNPSITAHCWHNNSDVANSILSSEMSYVDCGRDRERESGVAEDAGQLLL